MREHTEKTLLRTVRRCWQQKMRAKITIYDQFNPSPWGAHMKCIQLIGNNKKVLDVGCATGLVAQKLKAKRCEVTGIEIDPDQADVAQVTCQDILVGDIEAMDLALAPSSFDVLLMADVLEHLKDPQTTLRKLSRFLSQDGFILVVLPNIAHFYFRLKLLIGQFDYQERGALDKSHLRFFTLKTAKKLCVGAGFEIESIDVTVPNVPVSLAFNKNFSVLYKLAYWVARLWKNMFAFQFIIMARLTSSPAGN